MIGLGTIVNTVAVIVGGAVGLLFNGKIPKNVEQTLMQGLGLSVIFIGLGGTLKEMTEINGHQLEADKTWVIILSLVGGSLLGELVDVEGRIENFGEWLHKKIASESNPRFTEAFLTVSLTICVGAFGVVGSINDGLLHDPTMLYTKAILDGVIVLIFASALGYGAIFSAIPLFLYQGSLTLLARVIAPLLTESMLSNLSFIGSILIICVGINLTFGHKFKVGNMLPAMIIAMLMAL